ncbi:hypothetical protein N2152v2_001688 [Parachlorella kessleri]
MGPPVGSTSSSSTTSSSGGSRSSGQLREEQQQKAAVSLETSPPGPCLDGSSARPGPRLGCAQERLQQHSRPSKAAAEVPLQEEPPDALRGRQSQLEWLSRLAAAPTYQPSREDWEEPLDFVRGIQGEAARYGICKVVPPVMPSVAPGRAGCLSDPGLLFAAGPSLGDAEGQQPGRQLEQPQRRPQCTLRQLEERADRALQGRYGGLHAALPQPLLEADLWHQLEHGRLADALGLLGSGAAVAGGRSGFDPEDSGLGQSKWNLQDRGRRGRARAAMVGGSLEATVASTRAGQ